MSHLGKKRVFRRVSAFSALLLLAPLALADGLTDILQRGSLRIGVSIFAPWTLENTAGELDGLEIEVGRRLAQSMGIELAFKVYVWDEIIDGLERGNALIRDSIPVRGPQASRQNRWTVPRGSAAHE
jgi:polar amino acid transport system substrate-binding protein